MKKSWYEVSINFADGNRMYICQFEHDLNTSLLLKKDNQFIKLMNVRWLKRTKKNKTGIIKLHEYNKTYMPDIYVKRAIIDSVFILSPIK